MKSLILFFCSNHKWNLISACIWTSLILIACFIPGDDLPKVEIFQVDKLVHIILFGMGSLLWAIALLKTKYARTATFLLMLFIATACLGILVELIQSTSLVRGRGGDFWDVVADAIGAALGILPVRTIEKILKRK